MKKCITTTTKRRPCTFVGETKIKRLRSSRISLLQNSIRASSLTLPEWDICNQQIKKKIELKPLSKIKRWPLRNLNQLHHHHLKLNFGSIFKSLCKKHSGDFCK